jgi:hypothetical protein
MNFATPLKATKHYNSFPEVPEAIVVGGTCGFRPKFTLRMPLVPTPARLKRAGVTWHFSQVSTPLTGSHCKLHPNIEGTPLGGGAGSEMHLIRARQPLPQLWQNEVSLPATAKL